jgi:predicted CoA-binding protein
VTEADLRELYRDASTIAVVGCSLNWPKPSAVVPAYMQSQGYRIIPVNPNEPEILGEPSVGSLAEISEPVDIVDVFRPADEAPGIARAAVELGARCLWLQTAIVSPEAREIAEAGGLLYVEDSCIGIAHGEAGLGPGVAAWKADQEAQRTA